jgi:hypothetical protein
MAGKFKLKRDISTSNPPNNDQVEVGELVFNAQTGKLYSKLQNGSIIEFIGKPVCFKKNPTIQFSDVTNFCCSNDILYVTVLDLDTSLWEDDKYVFGLADITKTNPGSTINGISINKENTTAYASRDSVAFSNYQDPGDISITDPSEIIVPVTFGRAIIPFDIILTNTSLLKFIVQIKESNEIVSQSTIRITCSST